MSLKRLKKVTLALVFAAGVIATPFVASNTDAVFKGPDPVTNGKIVYAAYGGKTIKAAFPDGTGEVTLMTDPDAVLVGDPVWSPDKSKVAFVMVKGGATHIYSLDGSTPNQTPTPLTEGSGEAGGTDPSWSPDGEHIIYAKNVNNISNLFIMDDNGDNQEQITAFNTTGRQGFDPSWSPVSGSMKVVYTVAGSIAQPPINSNVYIATVNNTYDAFSSDEQLLGASWDYSDEGTPGYPGDLRGEYDPQFSPDGTKVIFVRRTPNGSYSIGTVLASNSSPTYTSVILNEELGGPVYDPAYSPDGKYVSFEPKGNLLSIGNVKIFNTENRAITNFRVHGAESDWTYLAEEEEPPEEITDVSVECTTQVGKSCTVEIPAYCTSATETPPAHGTSTVTLGEGGTDEAPAPGTLTYTPTLGTDGKWNEQEENYVHIRDNGVSTAKCFVKIKFTKGPGGGVIKAPATGIVGGLIGMGLAGAIAGAAIYAKEHKEKKTAKAKSEK